MPATGRSRAGSQEAIWWMGEDGWKRSGSGVESEVQVQRQSRARVRRSAMCTALYFCCRSAVSRAFSCPWSFLLICIPSLRPHPIPPAWLSRVMFRSALPGKETFLCLHGRPQGMSGLCAPNCRERGVGELCGDCFSFFAVSRERFSLVPNWRRLGRSCVGQRSACASQNPTVGKG